MGFGHKPNSDVTLPIPTVSRLTTSHDLNDPSSKVPPLLGSVWLSYDQLNSTTWAAFSRTVATLTTPVTGGGRCGVTTILDGRFRMWT